MAHSVYNFSATSNIAKYRVGHKKPSPYMSANYVFQE